MGSDVGEARSQLHSRHCPTILVVEDNVLVRMVISDQLREAGFAVIESMNADEAVAVLRCRGDVAVIVSDVQMPGSLDGIGLAGLVRSELPGIKVILVSGHVRAADLKHHDGFFSKPYDVDELIALLRTLTR